MVWVPQKPPALLAGRGFYLEKIKASKNDPPVRKGHGRALGKGRMV